MRYAMRSGWAFIVLIMALALEQCGKTKNQQGSSTPIVTPYVPSGWDGAEDWSHNVLKVEDVTP